MARHERTAHETHEADCAECRHLRLEADDAHAFEVVPADGGGWRMWSKALLRLVRRMGDQPTQAIVISQEPFTQRYVQAIIGHGIARVQASSNVYLTGMHRLTAEHEQVLALLGWLPPTADADDPDEYPANWSLPLVYRTWDDMVEVIAATLIGVFGFTEHLPVSVITFGCVHPCRTCSWPDTARESR